GGAVTDPAVHAPYGAHPQGNGARGPLWHRVLSEFRLLAPRLGGPAGAHAGQRPDALPVVRRAPHPPVHPARCPGPGWAAEPAGDAPGDVPGRSGNPLAARLAQPAGGLSVRVPLEPVRMTQARSAGTDTAGTGAATRGWRVYGGRRVAPLLILGFASGLPLALTSGTLQAWATVAQVSLQSIGFLTLAGTAYTLKFLWAPLVDRYAPPWLGRRRGWVFLTQWLLAGSIAAMGLFDPGSELRVLALLAVWVAFLSATQDIAFDAYSTDVLRQDERAAGAALKVMGYRLAMVVSGGLALILADQWLGWGHMYMLMGGLMALASLATLWAPEPEVAVRSPRTLREAVAEPLKEFFGRRGAWAILLLIVLYKLGDAFAGALSTT